MISKPKCKYRFVERDEYDPKRQRFEMKILNAAREFIEENYRYTFVYDLIGSAGRGLVTERINGNTGYDFDYNLILKRLDDPFLGRNVIDIVDMNGGLRLENPTLIKEQFRLAFNYAVQGTEYDFPEDSSSVLTIKCKDRKNSRILHGADLAIVYYDQNGIVHTLEHYKPSSVNGGEGYGFQTRDNSYCIDSKLDEILDFLDDGWDLVKAKYLQLKNSNNDPNKKSFILYVEAVNNIRNEYDQDIYDEMYRQGYVG